MNISLHNVSKLQKLVLIVGFFSLTVTILLLGLAPSATSYEISVYVAFDQFSWLTLSMAIACGLIILVHAIIVPARSKIWVSALFLVLLSNALILILPILRGYFFYGNGDPLTHLSIIRRDSSNRKISEYQFLSYISYPDCSIYLHTWFKSGKHNVMGPFTSFRPICFPSLLVIKTCFYGLKDTNSNCDCWNGFSFRLSD